MIPAPTTRQHEAEQILCEQLGDVLTQAHLVRNIGTNLNCPQRASLELLLSAVRAVAEQFGEAK